MTDLKEILFSETDGSCAYCGIKDYRVLTVHHLIQQEPKDESYDNKIVLCHNCHHLYNQRKGPSEDDLRSIKKRLIYKTLT
jgi:5-methylcytosine-specific restriction endonuclease McrA